ncbi:MAG: AmmeMemoRadiSam system radical SAM enzyme [Treponema sp.]|nr:AmmeMemoRadiSam system radical SAM enzyme [Treponema sp.]
MSVINPNQKITCATCFYRCALAEGQVGQCRARANKNGSIVPLNYGMLTSLSLDPIEKKPLYLFYPDSMILSAGSFGCNLHCPFCQNASISQVGDDAATEYVSPEMLAQKAEEFARCGNIGVAFTYNEPLISWEYVRDASLLVHERGMKNVVVTSGSVNVSVLEEVLPHIDAMNIDLKGFTDSWYKKLGGDFEIVKNAITLCQSRTHVELTTLIVPHFNDSENEMRELARWVSKIDANIPLHITRFFPRYLMADGEPTPVATVRRLAQVAREYLLHVFTGNC